LEEDALVGRTARGRAVFVFVGESKSKKEFYRRVGREAAEGTERAGWRRDQRLNVWQRRSQRTGRKRPRKRLGEEGCGVGA